MVALHGQFNVNLRVDLEPVQVHVHRRKENGDELAFFALQSKFELWSALVENVAPGLVYEKCQMIL
jgi:hypothetical protein